MPADKRPNDEDLEKAREIKVFLEKNYKMKHNYDKLAKKFIMNKHKLKTAFKSVANCNVQEFVTGIRLEHAKRILESTNGTIGNIAREVGLDKSNFIIQFKNFTGQTPTEWRNQL